MTTDPLTPHRHDNNETPPTTAVDMLVTRPDGTSLTVTLAQLQADFPTAVIPRYQFSTDHGVHGPYRLAGVALAEFATAVLKNASWTQAEIISADGFGNRVWRHELEQAPADAPVLLCTETDGRPLTRAEGLVRLVVPSETDNALRQIKWVAHIRFK